MQHSNNPFDHLPEKYITRQLERVSKKITKMALKNKTPVNFELQRALLLTLSEAVARKREVSWLEDINTEEIMDLPKREEGQLGATLTSDVSDETK